MDSAQLRTSHPSEAVRARTLLRWSWIIPLSIPLIWLVFVYPIIKPQPERSVVVIMVTAVPYITWSIYWGLVWERERLLKRYLGRLPSFAVFLVVLVLLNLIIGIAGVFGMFGGAVIQHLRHRRLALNSTRDPSRAGV